MQEDQRYSFENGIRRMWVYSNDKPHFPTSHTRPRTEVRIQVIKRPPVLKFINLGTECLDL